MANFTEEWLRERTERIFGTPAPTEPAKPKRRKVSSEAEIAKVCTQVLIHDGWRHLKTDPVSRRGWGKGFGEVGMADSLFIRYDKGAAMFCHGSGTRLYSEVLWIEWKREDGAADPHQLKWHAAERARGALTLIAGIDFEASVEGFLRWYAGSGLRQRVDSRERAAEGTAS